MMFGPIFLLAAAQALPAIGPDCRRDRAGECLPVEVSPLATLLRADHHPATSIYRSYWNCYWNAFSSNERFRTSNARHARQVFAVAFNECAALRALADDDMDDFLRPRTEYGDEGRKRFIRDSFRRSAGKSFLDQAALAEGKHDAYARTLNAYRKDQRD